LQDKSFHGRMPEPVKTEVVHFFGCLFGGPLIESNAVSGDKDPGTIIAEMTMNEYFLLRVLREDLEKLRHLFGSWRRPAVDGNVNKTKTVSDSLPALPGEYARAFVSEVHDGRHAKPFQFRESCGPGLSPAEKPVIHLSGVGDAFEAQFHAQRRDCGLGANRKRKGRGKNEG